MDTTDTTAIPTFLSSSSNAQTTVTNVSGNVITLSQAVRSPGVANGDAIAFAEPRSAFKTLSAGCSLLAGTPGCKYPWAIYNNGQFGLDIDHVLINGGWDGIYLRGQTFNLRSIYLSVLDQGINSDQNLNFSRMDNVQMWNGYSNIVNWGSAFNANYFDGNTVCLNLGENDGLAAGVIQCFCASVNLLPSWSWGTIDSLMMDGTGATFSDGGTKFGWVDIQQNSSTKGTPGSVPIAMTGNGILNNWESSCDVKCIADSLAAGNIQVTNGGVRILSGEIPRGGDRSNKRHRCQRRNFGTR